MEYLTVRETAEKWKISPRMVQQFPHRDLIAFQFHDSHLRSILCAAVADLTCGSARTGL